MVHITYRQQPIDFQSTIEKEKHKTRLLLKNFNQLISIAYYTHILFDRFQVSLNLFAVCVCAAEQKRRTPTKLLQ